VHQLKVIHYPPLKELFQLRHQSQHDQECQQY